MIDEYVLKDPQRDYRLFFVRLLVCAFVVVVMLSVLVWRYFHLQVTRHEDFAARADSNRVLVRPVPPPRGRIYDRNGVLLADNRPGFNLTIVRELSDDLDGLLGVIGSLVSVTEADIEKFRRRLKRRQRPYEPVVLRFGLDETELSVLAVNGHRLLPGARITAESLRYYPMGERLAHVIGYVGRINERELRTIDLSRYQGTHIIGKTGLEKKYQNQLLGQVGYEKVETNVRGRVMRDLERDEPVPGTHLHLHLDIRLQQVAYEALAGERAAVVALEVATGGVLAMVSTPSFDPNLFVTGISHKDYNSLLDSPDRPLFDRVSMGQYPPGSTLKPLYGLAALETNTISSGYRIYDTGVYQLEDDERKYRDWKKGGHGWVTLREAISQSCDTFFYEVGFRMGIDAMADYGHQFGLGNKTGIDMPSESQGIMPTRAWKQDAKGVAWFHGDTVNASIGQGFTLATPIQLAVMTSRLATRGEVTFPRLVRQVPDGNLPAPADNRIAASPDNWQFVHSAMEDVVHHPMGTAQGIRGDIGYRMAGKTGTSQIIGIKQDEEYDAEKIAKRNRDHALFIAFAPAGQPRIALAVIVENGEHGSSTAAPIARKIIDAYMSYYPEAAAPVAAKEKETAQ